MKYLGLQRYTVSYFPCCYDKGPKRSNLQEKGFILAPGLGEQPIVAGKASWLEYEPFCSHLGKSGRWRVLVVYWLSAFSILVEPGTPARGLVSHICTPLLINHPWKHPHRHTQRCVSLKFQVFLNPVELTMGMNYHTHYLTTLLVELLPWAQK